MKNPYQYPLRSDGLVSVGEGFFDSFWKNDILEHHLLFSSNRIIPLIHVNEGTHRFYITADIHEFLPKDIKVEIESDGIALTGKTKYEYRKKRNIPSTVTKGSLPFIEKYSFPPLLTS